MSEDPRAIAKDQIKLEDAKNLPVISESSDYPYFDEDNEQSLINLLPSKIAEHFSRVPEEWINMSEKELKKHCYPEQWSPTIDGRLSSSYDQDTQLRYAFWLEYDLATSKGRKMVMGNVFRDICTPAYFQNIVVQDRKRAAWILKPPGNYSAKIQALMWMGQESRFNILSLPIVYQVCKCSKRCVHGFKVLAKFKNHCEHCSCLDKCCCAPTVDTKLADLQQKIAEAVELRAKGSIPIKQMNMNFNRNEEILSSKPAAQIPSGPEDIDKELERLRGEVARLGGADGELDMSREVSDGEPDGGTIDVSPGHKKTDK